ncbi:MAG TPA: response regulator [Candidatus Acidoferrales bacterium]|nr:response regulator [Candidatus Acidoferrales bacterium]
MSRNPAKGDSPLEKPLRLLIAEDDPNDLELCLRNLKKSGVRFEASTVSTREEFIQKLREQPFDVVLADYRMKGWTGMDALAAVKEICPDVPLVLLSGTLGDEFAVECIKLGVTDYVLKDQLARLPRALRRAQEEKALHEAEMQAHAALRESEARYRSLVQNATYGMFLAEEPEGKLLDANPALAAMLGYDSVDGLLRIQHTRKLYCNPADQDKIIAEYMRRGRADATVEWKRKDGKIVTVRLNGRHATGADGKSECAEVIVEDITERMALEKQLVQAQKFEAIGQLAGGIAHDFNNMLGAILGWADMGIEETESGSRLHRHFDKVHQQAERAAALTRQLLAFARRQILEPRNVDLNQMAIETLSLLEKVIGSNIEIKANLAPNLSVVRADPTQVEQVLMNLCINARDAMPGGGSLIIETSNTALDERFCALQPLARPGVYAMLSVTDTGTGMDAATLDRIFEPFFTTKELGKGTGLGLATVYGIVRQHGGFVHVYSELGTGSTFRAYFPVSAVSPESPAQAVDAGPIQGGSETILVAEDHEGLRELAQETLAGLGYQIVLAIDGEQAMQEFRAHRDRIDLALLDVMLPKINGPEIYARIREEKPDLRVIFATGYSPDIDLLRKVQAQGLPVLQKPYSSRDLAHKIRETLDQRPADSPRLGVDTHS